MSFTVNQMLRRHLFERAGVYDYGERKHLTLEDVRKSNWSPEFEKLMRAKFILGGFRYGLVTEQIKGGRAFNHIESIKQRLKYFDETGDQDVLPDIANLAMAEWIHPHHPKAHRGRDEHGYFAPGRMKV